jgi:cytochrome c oxidase subunit IV
MSESHDELGHVVSLKILFGVFAALLGLTVITVAAIKVDLGEFNIVVAMAVATAKAALVVLYFMHLRWDKGFNRVAFFGGLVFFGLFMAIAMMDTNAYKSDVIWKEHVLNAK